MSVSTYSPVDYYRVGGVWPRNRLRERYVPRKRKKFIPAVESPPEVTPDFTGGKTAVFVIDRSPILDRSSGPVVLSRTKTVGCLETDLMG